MEATVTEAGWMILNLLQTVPGSQLHDTHIVAILRGVDPEYKQSPFHGALANGTPGELSQALTDLHRFGFINYSTEDWRATFLKSPPDA